MMKLRGKKGRKGKDETEPNEIIIQRREGNKDEIKERNEVNKGKVKKGRTEAMERK